MKIRNFLLVPILLYTLACNNTNQTAESVKEISKSISEPENNLLSFEGKFVKIEKMNDRDFNLFLKNNEDSIITFITMMPLSDDEIKLFKKDGNNIKLNYSNFYNTVRRRTDKIVKSMAPIYEFEK